MAAGSAHADGVLFGRDHEQSLLDALLDRASGGESQGVLVVGAVGVGKTALARTVSERRSDTTVLFGACLPLISIAVPLLALRALLRAAPEALDAPDIDESQPVEATLTEIDGWLTGLCARQAVVVIVDDLQWADQGTLDVLTYLIAGPPARRLTIVATIRSEEVGDAHPLQRWLADIRRLPRLLQVTLEPLDHAATAAQIAALLGEVPHTELVDDVFSHSRGNPYLNRLIVERLPASARRIDAELPRDLRTAVLGRWSRLGQAAREATAALAVAGRPLPVSTLATVLAEDESGVHRALEASAVAGLIESRPDAMFWFRHPLSAEVLEQAVSIDRSEALHMAFAMLLESELTDGDVQAATAIADHWNLAGEPGAALRWALRGAACAEGVGAWPDALRMLDRAVALSGSAGTDELAPVLRRQVDAALHVGALRAELEAIDRLIHVVERSPSVADPGELSSLLVRRIHLRFLNGKVFFDPEEARRAVAAAPPRTVGHAFALAELAHSGMWHGDPAAADNARRALAEARECGDDRVLSYALTANAMQAVFAEDGMRGLALATAGADAALRAGDWWALGHAALWEANASETWATESFALRVSRRREQMREHGAPRAHIAWMGADLAASSLAVGDWKECALVLRETFASDPGPLGDVQSRLIAARLATLQGRQREAEQHLARADELFDVTSSFLTDPFDPVRAEVCLGGRDPAGAWDAALRAITSDELPPTMSEWLLPLAARAGADLIGTAHDSDGDDRELRRRLEALVADHPEIIRDLGEWTPLMARHLDAFGALYAAEFARGMGAADEGERWVAAADALVAAGLPWEEAYARRRAAEALLVRDGDRVRGADQLRRGLALAQRLAAAPVESALRALARHARVAIARPEPLGADLTAGGVALTPREREILSLVVAGRTYGEIARELVISDKTVSTHISHLLDKTGTANRVELAGYAERMLSASSG